MMQRMKEYLMTKRYREILYDTEYLLNTQVYDDPGLKQLAQKTSTFLGKALIFGSMGGMSLALSLRRYLPGFFGTPSVNRAMIDGILVFGVSILCVNIGLQQSMTNIKNLKYGLAKTHNEQYINHLRVKAREFQYRSEYNLLRDVFNKEEYLKWKEQHPRSLLQ